MTFEEMCMAAHMSPGWVHVRDGRFTPFKCPCCEYKPTETQWFRDKGEHVKKSDEEQKVAQAIHLENGVPPEKQN